MGQAREACTLPFLIGASPVCYGVPTGSLRSIVKINGVSCVNRKNIVVALASYENGGKNSAQNAPEKLEPLWDDGYGTQTMKDYTKIAMDLIRLISSDGGQPRWFCPVAYNRPLKDSFVLMYLPGLEGTGTGLVVHEKALGKQDRHTDKSGNPSRYRACGAAR